jgi:hypothetical protein
MAFSGAFVRKHVSTLAYAAQLVHGDEMSLSSQGKPGAAQSGWIIAFGSILVSFSEHVGFVLMLACVSVCL